MVRLHLTTNQDPTPIRSLSLLIFCNTSLIWVTNRSPRGRMRRSQWGERWERMWERSPKTEEALGEALSFATPTLQLLQQAHHRNPPALRHRQPPWGTLPFPFPSPNLPLRKVHKSLICVLNFARHRRTVWSICGDLGFDTAGRSGQPSYNFLCHNGMQNDKPRSFQYVY